MMTTPEHFRRRQLVEGLVLILLALFSVGQTIMWQDDNGEQDKRDRDLLICVENKFRDLSVALDARSALVARESRASQNIWSVWARAAGLLKDDPTEELPPAEQEQLQRDLVDALLAYDETIRDVQRERRENPYPPYPVGACS